MDYVHLFDKIVHYNAILTKAYFFVFRSKIRLWGTGSGTRALTHVCFGLIIHSESPQPDFGDHRTVSATPP